MKFLTVVWIIFFSSQTIYAKSLSETLTEESKVEHQCHYNGKTFKDGEDLPTKHLCLSCKCSKDFVEPNDIYCKVLDCPQTNHLELGCIPVYNGTECCPVEWKCDQQATAKCDKRYFKHYQVKKCIPVHEDGSDCPVRFNCPPVSNLPAYENECEFQGRLFKEGDMIDIGNPCQICSCRKGWRDEKMEISCISVECPSVFRSRLNDSCYEVFESGKCCSVRTECKNPDEISVRTEKTCNYGGKSYRLGEKIYPEEDPCLICTCDARWTGIYGNSCRVHDCSLERKRKQIVDGCLPIYHEGTCCPIEFFCGSEVEGFKNTTESLAKSSDIQLGNTCIFKGIHYKLGQMLDINHPTHCVTCSCSTPPDFTCIHKQCPRPPNDDYENCSPSYTPGQCCATYTCNYLSAPVEHQCSPVRCPDGCQEVTVHNSCPFCQCQERLCAPPKCAPGCHLQNDTKKGQCPECKCPESLTAALACSPVKCGSQCYEVIGSLGCPMCVCGPLCSPPKCGPGCHVQRNVGEGECPGCVCDNLDQTKAGSLQCSPVRCPTSCREIVSKSGCPACVCDPLCSSPKCEEGCWPDTSPQSPGECPGCICGNQGEVSVKQCAPVKCGPLCHMAFDGTGCPTCICDPLCSPPVCHEGCNLEHDPSQGPCPICVCKTANIDECPKIKCSPECHERMGAYGCPTCFCGPVCSPPKCDSGCHLEYDQSAGPCPACVCFKPRSRAPTRTAPAVACSPVRCDAGCIEATGDNGCPHCICDPQCSPPVCKQPCALQYDPTKGPCPSCDCPRQEAQLGIQCTIPKCEDDCVVDYSALPCPTCTCGALSGIQCSPPNCEAGCQIDYSTHPCPSCNCGHTLDFHAIQCSTPKCDPSCRLDYNAKPCPACTCGNQWGVLCSPPKCNPGCHIDYSSRPCPSCDCSTSDNEKIMCSTPKCEPGCQINYNSKPCPSCVCSQSTGMPDILCSPPKCDEGCRVDYSTKPCPSCKCDQGNGVKCSTPKCGNGCHLNYNSKPCPSCECSGAATIFDPLCSMPKCEAGCRIEYSTKPCPTCDCTDKGQHRVLCSTPKCGNGCRLNHNTEPCPTCECTGAATIDPLCSMPKCDTGCLIEWSSKPCPTCYCPGKVDQVQCTTPKCGNGCRLNPNTKPCPTCECTGAATIDPQCSMPKCDTGCLIESSSKPCPTCYCPGKVDQVQCTTPKCGIGCRLNHNTKPCPTCECTGAATIDPLCSMPKCDTGCLIDASSKPCPTCHCPNQRPPVQCSPPKCRAGCYINYSTRPCPSCSCSAPVLPVIQCSPPLCDSGCSVNYDAKPCPACQCGNATFTNIQCSPLVCDPDCNVVMGSEGCPTCDCSRHRLCAIPMCGPGCRMDYNADPCPTCVCDKFQRRYASQQLNVFRDPFCSQLKCGPGCERAAAPSSPTERCPMCVCRGKVGERLTCAAMQCQLPCRWRRFTEHGCPSCVCFTSHGQSPMIL